MASPEQPDRIALLAQKWQEGTITPAEQAEFDEWYNHADNTLEINSNETFEEMEARLYQSILVTGNIKPTKIKQLWPRIAVAASILLFLSVGGYFLLHKQPSQQIVNNQHYSITPGSNKAVLTLANGRQVNLNEAGNGIIANEGNIDIRKSGDDKISYENRPSAKVIATIGYNTITTPRGGQWPVIILPDGSKAVLDASSSIKYPVVFVGNNRNVEITGQVYFEVVHNAAHPFKVIAGNQIIEDLGTHFNVNAYKDEPVSSTTLLEGAVKITVAGKSALLKPGQRALVKPGSNTINVNTINTDDAIAWKNGQISFKNETIQQIMRQVSRWYDVNVEYKGNLPERKFTGGISRNANLSDLLKILEFNNIHFTVNGKKITVTQ